MNKFTYGIFFGASLLVHIPAHAEVLQYTSILTGLNETNGSGTFGLGDLDGVGTATLMIDNVANTIAWDFQVNNIALPLTAAHIHPGNATQTGAPIVNFSAQLSGSGPEVSPRIFIADQLVKE